MLTIHTCAPPMCTPTVYVYRPPTLTLPRAAYEDPFAPSSSTQWSSGSTGGATRSMAASFRQQLEGFRSAPTDSKVGWRWLGAGHNIQDWCFGRIL